MRAVTNFWAYLTLALAQPAFTELTFMLDCVHLQQAVAHFT